QQCAANVLTSASLKNVPPQSMLPDVVDHFRLLNPHAKGPETIFYSSYVFFTKMSAGIGLGISTASLEFAGYKTGMCRQSSTVILTLKILIGAVPAILIVIGLSILLFYPITEKSRKETEFALELLRAASLTGCQDSGWGKLLATIIVLGLF
uniref:MFSD2 lysolipid transporter B, sphingolipid n=1 Tax=Terrapene triunguis TaxID=2587831 RepID=A0A674IIY2_9SAUR